MAQGIIHNVDVPNWATINQWSSYLRSKGPELLIEQPSVTPFLPEIKLDLCVLAVDGKVHVKQVESHHCLPLVQGVFHNVDVPIELQSMNYLPTLEQMAQGASYNVELLI